MRAIQHSTYGTAAEVLHLVDDAPIPVPGAGEILVRVHATSVNPIDCAVRGGYGAAYWEKIGFVKQPHIPGRDVAGTVAALGEGVTGYTPGDAVWAGTLSGGTADYMAIPADWAAPAPPSLSFAEAGSIPYAILTAWAALVDHAGLTPENAAGKRVVVPRGAGGVGSLAIQLLKAWGAEVATIVSTRNVDLVRELGADTVIDYTRQDFADHLHGYDVAFDTSFDVEDKLLGALKTGADAAYVSIVTPKLLLIDRHGLEEGLARGEALFAERVAAQKALGRRYAWAFMKPNGEALRIVGDLVRAGRIRPVIDRVLPMTEMVAAHEYCESRQARGKIVIDVAGTPA
ncbi:zinc-binding dehydrogenase [Niveispirillum fermenti]|uniref:zinc-binding dehydrogenase n=1 Tax=Niveispirillum fermenti TaxID=1233113 RepID=UPI003A873C92